MNPTDTKGIKKHIGRRRKKERHAQDRYSVLCPPDFVAAENDGGESGNKIRIRQARR